MKTICLIGFRSTESLRVVSSLKLNAIGADIVDLDGDLSALEKLGEAVMSMIAHTATALVEFWMGASDPRWIFKRVA